MQVVISTFGIPGWCGDCLCGALSVAAGFALDRCCGAGVIASSWEEMQSMAFGTIGYRQYATAAAWRHFWPP